MSNDQNKDNKQKDQPSEPAVIPDNAQKAAFAAGCFWHVQYGFDKVAGVLKTTVGYTAGQTENPTYKEVCTDKTGHAEAIEVIYDPEKITYEQLLDEFWQMHNPTQLNRQGPDIGTQYRSAIYYYNEDQKAAALKSKQQLDESEKYNKPIVTQVEPAERFYPAEEYHQKYFEKNGKVCGI